MADDPATFDRIKVETGQALFGASCRHCHATDATDPSYGPLLDGVVGRKAGSFDGYACSAALKAAGFVRTTGALKASTHNIRSKRGHRQPAKRMQKITSMATKNE